MSQPTLQQLFAASSKKSASSSLNISTAPATLGSKAGCTDSAAAVAAAGAAGTRKHGTDQLKENRPVVQGAAAGTHSKQKSSSQGRPTALQHAAAATKHVTQPQQQQRSTQLYLDLGQRNFGASRCSVCGMVYTKGHEEDEKLHKAYHQGSMQGFKFQGWLQERVLLSEVAQGRLLMVLQTDPANHVKKVRELCAVVEKTHGMAPGWLLAAPQARVFLYVSSQRRVVGLAVVEPLKQAYRVMAPVGSQEQEVDSVARAAQPPQQQVQQQQRAQAGGPSILDTAAPQQQQAQAQKRQSQQLLWPGLRKRGRLAALGRAAGSAGNMLQSDPSLHSGSQEPSCNLKADSCPTSLLAAAGRLQVECSGGVPAGQVAAGAAAAAATARSPLVKEGAAGTSSQAAAAVGWESQDGAVLALSQPQQQDLQGAAAPQQQQQQQQQPSLGGHLMGPPPPKAAHQQHQQQLQQQQQQPPEQRDAAASMLSGSRQAPSRVTGASGAESGGFGGASSSMRRAGFSSAAAAAAAGGSGGRSLLIDQRKAHRAMLGVRMVWVSPEQRRRGMATKLLDAARCNMVPGYVVPCNQVAFSQPTGDGVALASGFAGTQQFLVYSIE